MASQEEKEVKNEDKSEKKGLGKSTISGAALGAAVGAGAYYLLGPNSKEHQKKAKAILLRMEKEVVREAKRAGSMSLPVYTLIVKKISDLYLDKYKAHAKDIRGFAKSMKARWQKTSKVKKSPRKKRKTK